MPLSLAPGTINGVWLGRIDTSNFVVNGYAKFNLAANGVAVRDSLVIWIAKPDGAPAASQSPSGGVARENVLRKVIQQQLRRTVSAAALSPSPSICRYLVKPTLRSEPSTDAAHRPRPAISKRPTAFLTVRST